MSKYIYTNSEHCPDYLTPGKLYEYKEGVPSIIDGNDRPTIVNIPDSYHIGNDSWHVLPDYYETRRDI